LDKHGQKQAKEHISSEPKGEAQPPKGDMLRHSSAAVATARENIFASVGIRNSIIRQHDSINPLIFG
jgi:hypothetical protein